MSAYEQDVREPEDGPEPEDESAYEGGFEDWLDCGEAGA